jgi:hypothetical protein
MNWTKLSAIAEILSSVAILATLVYLTIQIHQNSEALQASTREATLENSVSTLNLVISDPDIWLLRSKPNLTAEERVKLGAYLFSLMERGRNIWTQYQSGAIDEETWLNFERRLIANLTYEQPRRWWSNVGRNFSPDFTEHIDARLKGTTMQTEELMIRAFD